VKDKMNMPFIKSDTSFMPIKNGLETWGVAKNFPWMKSFYALSAGKIVK